jgi:uncharacterized protein
MVARGTFIVPVHDLDVDGRDVTFPITAAWLRGALEECEMQPAGREGRIDAHFTKSGNDVLVQAQVDVELAIPCARCLKTVELRPNIEMALLLRPTTPANPAKRPKRGAERAGADEPEGELAPDEADLDTYEGDEVVLDRFLREAILLESPTFPLCSEACEGIRPASDSVSPTGHAVTDPRLLPLLELAKRRNMKE